MASTRRLLVGSIVENDTIVVAGTNLPGQKQRAVEPTNPFGGGGGKKARRWLTLQCSTWSTFTKHT